MVADNEKFHKELAMDRGVITFYKVLAEIGGGPLEGLFLSQLAYWANEDSEEDGWVYKTQEDWENETMLSRYQQETVRRNLRATGILEEKRVGIPAVLRYRINHVVLGQKLADIKGIDNERVPYTR